MRMKLRRGWLKIALAVFVILCVFLYSNYLSKKQYFTPKISQKLRDYFLHENIDLQIPGRGQGVPSQQCPKIPAVFTNISTAELFPNFSLKPPWIQGREFWDENFEKRYLHRRSQWPKLPLKVILMPHSHNDPGWLKTYEEYYFDSTSKVLSNMVEELENSNMTFIWSEVSYLSMWFERAHPKMREKLKKLVHNGQLEIGTGGWIMTDEASPDLYAIVTQLIEGHQWLKNNLDIEPRTGWSIDPFGHGSAVPYILKEAGLESTVIQRIHYIWKQWLAERQAGDFLWRQTWDADGDTDLLTHNLPYDIYSIKHSCGPHPQICLNFDFRKVTGEYTEYSMKATNIDDKNVKEKSELLIEQYGRTGSLYPHNVVLVPIGDDFRYTLSKEFQQQYKNYQRLMNWVNSHPSYHVEMKWGTLSDYFTEVRKRTSNFPTLKGDFFVYSDIFSNGIPAYWSGYFTTRPYLKWLSRHLQAVLSSADFLYTWAWAVFKDSNFRKVTQVLEKDFEKLVKSRRSLSVFQHHDAITGTSKARVMHDYGLKLHQGIKDSLSVLSHASFALTATEATLIHLRDGQSSSLDFLLPVFDQENYNTLPSLIPVGFDTPLRLIVLSNALAQRRQEVVRILVFDFHVRLTDEHGHDIPFQIGPSWVRKNDEMKANFNKFELMFIADLPPLSVVTYTLHKIKKMPHERSFATVFTSEEIYENVKGTNLPFKFKTMQQGDIQLENEKIKVVLDGTTGLLRTTMNKRNSKVTQFMMKYGAYPSAQFKSGAYLFKPDVNQEPEIDVLAQAKVRMFIHSGQVASEVTVMFGYVLLHTFRVFHAQQEPLASSVFMENSFDLSSRYNDRDVPGFPPQFRDTELFFRFQTDIDNGNNSKIFTDQNGLGMQERTRVHSVGIEASYYPISSAVYLEDNRNARERRRITLLVDRAVGVASLKTGYLESMIERKTLYDDGRGMGEGVTDQKRTIGKYWLLVEPITEVEDVPTLSLAAHHLSNSLNNPVIPLVLDGLESDSLKSIVSFITRPFPCSLKMLSIRTLAHPQMDTFPSNKSLMVIQHQLPSCRVTSSVESCRGFSDHLLPETCLTLPFADISETSLTGLQLKRKLKKFSDLVVPHHSLRSLVITF